MNIRMLKTIFVAGACALLPVAAEALEPIIVQTVINNSFYDLGAAEKRFNDGDPTIMKLVPLTEEQLQQTANLSDTNRLFWRSRKATRPTYQYGLDLPSEQHAAAEAGSATEPAGEVSFYVLSNVNTLSFVFRSTSKENAKYEIILKPTQPGRFAGNEVHFMFEQSSHIWSTTILSPSCLPLNSNPVACGFRPEHRRTKDGAVLTHISLSWDTVYKILGELPMVGNQPSLWEFSVFRWAKSGSSTLRGTPRDPDAATYLMVQPISMEAISRIKGSYAQSAVDEFFRDDPKKGNPTQNYIGGIRARSGDLHLWLERLWIPPRIAFPGPMSEYFLAKMPRRVAKPVLGDDEKTKELNFRLVEWMEDMTYYGKEIKDRAYAVSLIDELSRLEIEGYVYPSIAYWQLRWEAIQRHFFSDDFRGDILKIK